jgi:hypothetical protein
VAKGNRMTRKKMMTAILILCIVLASGFLIHTGIVFYNIGQSEMQLIGKMADDALNSAPLPKVTSKLKPVPNKPHYKDASQ